MAEWDHFVIDKSGKVTIIDKSGKVIINNEIELNLIELPSGRYFLDKETIANRTNQEDLIVYNRVAYYKGGKGGITSRVTDTKELSRIIQEIEENLIK
jgi:hypothetical protein